MAADDPGGDKSDVHEGIPKADPGHGWTRIFTDDLDSGMILSASSASSAVQTLLRSDFRVQIWLISLCMGTWNAFYVRGTSSEIAEAIRTKKIATCYPLEFRFVKADDIWLSPFYKRDAVTISVHQYAGQDLTVLFNTSEAIFRRYGGRPHWGKMHTLRAKDFETLYPRFDDFRALRRKLDPNGRFLNSHLRDVFGEANG